MPRSQQMTAQMRANKPTRACKQKFHRSFSSLCNKGNRTPYAWDKNQWERVHAATKKRLNSWGQAAFFQIL
jgi:hypothetical protein